MKERRKSLSLYAQLLNSVQLFATPWTGTCQAPLSMEFFRQQYWSGLPFPSSGNLPDPGIEPTSLLSPSLACGFFTIASPGKPYKPEISIKECAQREQYRKPSTLR